MATSNHTLTILIALILTQLILGEGATPPDSVVIAPHCSSKCGNVTIPYPFGIEKGCYYVDNDSNNQIMSITCNHSSSPPMAFLDSNFEILSISVAEAEIRINNQISYDCLIGSDDLRPLVDPNPVITLALSSTKNTLVATGCDTYAMFSGFRHGETYITGCMTECNKLEDVVDDKCDGIGCCEASILDGVANISASVTNSWNQRYVPFSPCSAAFPVAKDTFKFRKDSLKHDPGFYLDYKVPVVYNWGIGSKSCSNAQLDGSCLCKNNTICLEQDGGTGYRCQCMDGFSGNPYLSKGCKDVNECEEANDCEKPKYCQNTNGSYFCKCPKGLQGKGTKTQGCVSPPWLLPVIIASSIGGGIIVLLLIGFLLHWRQGEVQRKELRESFFRKNGGVILHQKLSNNMEVMKIFTSKEVEDATDNYNDVNIIGRGGFGVVYKGLLPNNQQVAIKRSLKVDPGQVEQFVNEVLVLSQINNRNVVKLLGCCLETEVPLLVYEFINNGTLHDHLHDEVKASRFTWHTRLRIASEIAEVLAYLHTTISTPIIHRDMKSMNILLDENYTAKVADFGASRLVPLEQDHELATMVLGTLGYLDPEYMQTSELTEKSDVYSFGVVLVELLARKEALSYQRPGVERSLAMHFLLKMKEDRLFDIIDRNIASNNGQGEIEQIKEVAYLAKGCLGLKGEERPTMKEVAMELEGIKRTAKKKPLAQYYWFVC